MGNSEHQLDCTTRALGDVVTVTLCRQQKTMPRRWSVSMAIRVSWPMLDDFDHNDNGAAWVSLSLAVDGRRPRA